MMRLSTLVPDKSISHRAILLSCLADGESRLDQVSAAEDCQRTLAAVRSIGCDVQGSGSRLTVRGGARLYAPKDPIDMGNSGTGIRLLMGVLAGQPFQAALTGDDSLKSRPMDRVARPLELMGAKFDPMGDRRPAEKALRAPFRVTGVRPLKAITWELNPASAQVKSAILLATLFADGVTAILEPAVTRDHTERMMQSAGLRVDRRPASSGSEITLRGGVRPKPFQIRIPGDFSAAAFFIALGLLSDRLGGIELSDIGLNPTRTAFLDAVRLMGGRVRDRVDREECGEPVGTITVESSPLRGIEVPVEWIPNLIDELPILSILAAAAAGRTVVRGARELRVKESDRIRSIVEMVSGFSGSIVEHEDGFEITGGRLAPRQDRFKTHADHRIAMAILIAAASTGTSVTVDNTECINTSFPGFFDCLGGVYAQSHRH